MKVNWRSIPWAKNSFAALSAACECSGITLHEVSAPENDITCYSLNSVNEPHFREEISRAECITIVGGPHSSACWEDVRQYADYVVIGEGEFTLPALIDMIASGSHTLPAGVASKEQTVMPNHCVLLSSYPPFTIVKGYTEITRGCPFGCGYCQTPQLFGRNMRHRRIDDIERATRVFRDVRFVTPNALAYGSDGIHLRLDKVEKLLRSLTGRRIFFGTFPSEVRPECISDASLDLIESHCENRKIHFGAQSGSNRVLQLLRRGHTAEDVMRAYDICRAHAMTPVVDYIVGLPYESDEEQRLSVAQMKEITRGGKVHVHHFTPLPGTPLAGMAARTILPDVQRELGRMALNGKATGSWIDAEVRFFKEDEDQLP
ncbi:TIGR04013 family B12-binding domain/radical SAM domain-containing protein [Methanogenium sp. S4BF]|uniref:TIGR04013 family B12-binding domain/radical SAM domain-containing protein n=1 Tax=Methanogenium sp. S4BF TaxID=1789226 RepID=UPI0024163DE2|nr:TIGR04013 family B12-binding domain/radical SAM domain-containing protein [Methanogenium sp. S4BF]WFN35169.1 TIGR04013 family B12-binding domain/radical SAM domain-containing protein [Methanogenium sp. S4BF]